MVFGVTPSKHKSIGVIQSNTGKIGVVPATIHNPSKMVKPYEKPVKLPVKGNDNYPPRNTFEKLSLN
jgi:hypothetical protein